MTISEYARKTIEEHADPGIDIFVASPSLPPEFLARGSEDATDEERALLPEAGFFYFPANLWPHKNHERLFEALRRLRARAGTPVELVLTGSPAGWEEFAEPLQRPARSPFRLRDPGPSQTALREGSRVDVLLGVRRFWDFLCSRLFMSVPPSFAANTTSLPEVAGDCRSHVRPDGRRGDGRLRWNRSRRTLLYVTSA